MPAAERMFLNTNGQVCASCLLYAYVAGTLNPLDTYTAVTLAIGTENPNPIVLSSSGQATIFLSATSYKFVLKDSTGATTYWTRDNVTAVPTSSSNLDITGTAGENIAAGQAVYLSDGSNSKTAGLWYKADATLPYASSNSAVGIAVTSMTSLATGSVRLGGQVTGLTSLATGSTYYLSGTAGALTATPPASARVVGRADSTTTLILTIPVAPPTAIDVLGTAGEALTAGQWVYLSAGDGSKTAGSWYKTDATLTYAGAVGRIGVITTTTASTAVGTIRVAGTVTGLSSLTAGTTYYLSGTPATITATNATAFRRAVGRADSTTSVVLAGDVQNYVPYTGVVVLADGATPALDASLGTTFLLTAAGDRTIGIPTNPTDGEKIIIRHLASGGARTLALNTGTGGFRFGSDVTALTQTASGKTDYIGCIYNLTDNKFDVVAVTKGF